MEVGNQIYTLSSNLLSYSSIVSQQQQLDSKLIAFCTILTVAFSILISFKQSRYLIINATKHYDVKRCIKCLKGFRVSKSSYKIISSLNYFNVYKSKYLKLKRLNIAHFASSSTTNILSKFSALTLFKMRKNAFRKNAANVSAPSSHYYRRFFRFRSTNTANGVALKNPVYMKTTTVNARFDLDNDLLTSIHSHSVPVCKLDPNSVYDDNFDSALNLNQNLNDESTRLHRSQSEPKLYNSKVRLYKKLPLRTISRAWGGINSVDLPVWCRKPCYQFYSWVFSCNLEEIDIEDLTEYKNLSEFFRRALKPNVRVIDQNSCIVSPCDGKILHFGKADRGYLEQVKGVNYALKAFLGEQNWPKNVSDSNNNSGYQSALQIEAINQNDALYEKSLLYNPNNELYHCIIYLAPGDYHRFHSPTDWEVFYRRHFPGELFSVNPSVARWLQGLFNLNERAVYYGQWKHGFFSFAAVGATNVGSIKVYMDENLETNSKVKTLSADELDKSFCSKNFESSNLNGVPVKRGENFGEFNLGSTIVLIFEAPPNFKFNINQNEKILFGSPLGSVEESTYL